MDNLDHHDENRITKKFLPCDDCGSSDAKVEREDGSSYCFSCSSNTNVNRTTGAGKKDVRMDIFDEVINTKSSKKIEDLENYRSFALNSRNISKEVVDHFGVKMELKADGSPAAHLYPFTVDGQIAAYKVRTLPKSFSVIGDFNKVELFGQAQASQGGKQLVITEGEIDAMSVAQSFKDYRTGKIFPVVGLPSASAKSAVLAQREWINSFEKVVVMMDNDEAGKKMEAYLCKILKPGKVFLAKLLEKDANEVLMKHGSDALIQATWDAKEWSPAGIVKGENIWEQFKERKAIESVPYPTCLAGLNDKLKGIRLGEITLFTSGTGSGKSTVIKECILNLLDANEDNMVGLISLEESVGDTAEKFIGMQLKKNLSEVEVPEAEEFKAYQEVFGDERLVLLDHQGSVGDNSLIEKIEHLCVMGCKYLVLDHITIAVSEGQAGKSGNEAVDAMMSDLLKIVKRHGVWLGLISHLRKAPSGGKSFEEGHLSSIDDIKGSGSIKQISFDIITFARDMTNDNEAKRNTVEFRVLKSRFTGKTGNAGAATYDGSTGRLTAVNPQDVMVDKAFGSLEEPAAASFEVPEATF